MALYMPFPTLWKRVAQALVPVAAVALLTTWDREGTGPSTSIAADIASLSGNHQTGCGGLWNDLDRPESAEERHPAGPMLELDATGRVVQVHPPR